MILLQITDNCPFQERDKHTSIVCVYGYILYMGQYPLIPTFANDTINGKIIRLYFRTNHATQYPQSTFRIGCFGIGISDETVRLFICFAIALRILSSLSESLKG